MSEHVFIECGMDLDNEEYPFKRKIFIWPSEIEKFRAYCNNIGVYKTMMQYVNPIWIQDHKGVVIIDAENSLKYGDFYLDFDYSIQSEKDFNKIKEDVDQAVKYLILFLSLDIDDIDFYFSGSKGIHLIVNANIFGLKPHIALNKVYKDIATDIERFCRNETLDTRVYDNKRMFRLTNSINKKSGLYKIPITYDELRKLSFKEIRKLAKQPRVLPQKQKNYSSKAVKIFKTHMEEWEEKLKVREEFSGRMLKIKTLPPCIKRMHERTFRETIDERNNSGTALTSFFFQTGMSKEETMARMIQWGEENCKPPLKEKDIKTIVNSVYSHQYRYGCESFKRLSGVCDKDNCPLFNKELKEETGEGAND